MPVDMEFYLLLPFYAAAMAATFRAFPKLPRAPLLFASLVVIALAGLAYRYLQARFNPTALTSFADEIIWIRNIFGMSSAFCIGIGLAIVSRMKFRPSPLPATLLLVLAVACEIVVAKTSSLEGSPITNRLIFGQTTFNFVGSLSVAFVMYVVIQGNYRTLNRLMEGRATAELLRWPMERISFIIQSSKPLRRYLSTLGAQKEC